MMDGGEKLEQIKNRLRKLKVLADRGEGGEADAAQRLLIEVAEKYGIYLDDLEAEETFKFSIKLSQGWQQSIFRQLVALKRLEVCGDAYDVEKLPFYSCRCNPKTYYLVCSRIEWLELTAQYEVLSRDYKKQRDAFTLAFLYSNDLLLPARDDTRDVSEKELEEHRAAKALSLGISRSERNRQIGYGGAM